MAVVHEAIEPEALLTLLQGVAEELVQMALMAGDIRNPNPSRAAYNTVVREIVRERRTARGLLLCDADLCANHPEAVVDDDKIAYLCEAHAHWADPV